MATNIQYLTENNLMEAHKHFMRLSEAWMPLPEDAVVEEDGEDEMPQDPSMGGEDPMAGGDPNAAGADPMAGGDPNAAGGEDPMAGGDPNAAGADPMAGGEDPMAGGADPMAGTDPMAGGAPMDAMPPAPEDDGTTIDIDGLTKAQEKLNVKQNQVGRDLGKVDSRITALIDTIGKLTTALDMNNSEIEKLKGEFEKRNPSQTEKLNLRSLDSYPYNVKPTEYWQDSARRGGYEVYGDNNEPTTQEYKITNDDVDNVPQDIADTFFNIDDEDIQTLDKIFKW